MATEVSASGAHAVVGWRRFGPFKSSGGNFYVVGTSAAQGPLLVCFKASDPTSTWTEQDSSNRPSTGRDTTTFPTGGGGTAYLDAEQDGDTIHVAWCGANYADDTHTNMYASFDMSADTWDQVDGTDTEYYISGISQTADDASDGPRVQINVRSDGDVLVAYNGIKTNTKGSPYERVYYARLESSTWTVDVAVGAGTNVDEVLLGMTTEAAGGADLSRIYYKQSNNYWKELTSGNTLDSSPTVFSWGGTSASPAFYPIDDGSGASGKCGVVYCYPDIGATGAGFAVCGSDSAATWDTSNGDINQNETSGLNAWTYDASNEIAYGLARDASTGGRNLISCTYSGTNLATATFAVESEETSSGEYTATTYSLLVDGTTIRYLYGDSANDIWYEEYSLSSTTECSFSVGVTGLQPALTADLIGSASASADLSGLTPAATAELLGQASASADLSGLTPAATVDTSYSAALDATLGGLAPAATAELLGQASLAADLSGITPAATAEVIGSASTAVTLSGLTPAATVDTSYSAALDATLGGLAPAATAEVIGSAALATDLSGVTPAATVDTSYDAALTTTLSGFTPAFTAQTPLLASLSADLSGVTPAATVDTSYAAVLDATLGGLEPALTAEVIGSAALATDLSGLTPAAAVDTSYSAALAATLGGLTPALTADNIASAALAADLSGLTPAATAEVIGSAALDATLGGLAPAFTAEATVERNLSVDLSLGQIDPAATADLIGSASASSTLGGVEPSATAELLGQAALGATLGGAEPAATVSGAYSASVAVTMGGVQPAVSAARIGSASLTADLGGLQPAVSVEREIGAVLASSLSGPSPAIIVATGEPLSYITAGLDDAITISAALSSALEQNPRLADALRVPSELLD